MITKKPWFRPKRWGWGWMPITWQGWLVILIFVGVIFLLAINIGSLGQTKFSIGIAISVIILIIICYLTGKKPESKTFDKK